MPWQNPLLPQPGPQGPDVNDSPLSPALLAAIQRSANRLTAGIPDVSGAAPSQAAAPAAPPTNAAPSAAQGGGQIAASTPRLANSPLMVDAAGNPISPAQPMSASELMQMNPSNMGGWTLGNQLQAAQLAAGGYNGLLHTANPSSPEAQAAALRQLQNNSVAQQAEGRLQAQLLGANGLQGTMGLGNRAQQLAEDQHAFNSNQSVANQNAYRNWLLQRSQNGQPPPTQEEAALFLARLPQVAGQPGTVGQTGAAPAQPGAAPAQPGPGFQVPVPAGTTPVTHPWGQMQNQLDVAFRQALAQTVQPGPGGIGGMPNGNTITAFIHSLAGNGVNLSPANSLAIRQYIASKVGPEAAEQWWQTRDSALPDIGLGAETPAAAARRMLRQASGIGASASNPNTPLLMRLLNLGDLLGNQQYQ